MTLESQFGPPSEPIDVGLFVQSALVSSPDLSIWTNLAHDQKSAIEAECSVSDVGSCITSVINDPRLFAHVTRSHHVTVSLVYDTAETSNKRKRKRITFPDPENQLQEVTEFQNQLDAVQLRSASLTLDSALFMRTQKISDLNALKDVKVTSAFTTLPAVAKEALVTITVYNRLAWGHGQPSRLSQHAVLGRQTLQDLYRVIPCVSKEFPDETIRNDHVVGYEDNQKPNNNSGCVICIEGLAYGDGRSQPDYAEKLLAQINTLPPDKRPLIEKAEQSLGQKTFDTLTLRLNEPYWLLHQGGCEHFIVIDQIRLRHETDPQCGYPLTLQVTPPLLDLCRACTKVPAVWSVVGDVRLGESPCLLCAPCWRSMGNPTQNGGVVAVRIPKHVSGWSIFD